MEKQCKNSLTNNKTAKKKDKSSQVLSVVKEVVDTQKQVAKKITNIIIKVSHPPRTVVSKSSGTLRSFR